MTFLLARAEGTDPTDSSLTLLVISALTVAVVIVVAAIPVATARRRRINREAMTAMMVIWGFLAAGSTIWFTSAQMAYSKEYTMRLMQNYDAQDDTGRPQTPWLIWGFLAAGYGGAILWSATAKTAQPRGFPLDFISKPRDPTG